MDEIGIMEEKYGPMFRGLADLSNQQPEIERERTRQLLGEFLHEIKNTIGLITSANAILERKIKADRGSSDSFDMLQISYNAAMKINRYIDLVSENFAGLIDAELNE